MKKFFLFVALGLTATFVMNAQEVHFGLKGGTSISEISGKEYSTLNNYRVGLYGGLFAEIVMSDKVSIQPEVLYAMHGSHQTNKYFSSEGVTSGETTIKLRYIDVPVMVKYKVYKGLSIQAGPQASFLLDSQLDFETGHNGLVIGNYHEHENLNEWYTDVSFGVNFGLGYDFNNGLFIDGRYSLGISDIAQMKQYTGSYKNNFFEFGVGYKFL